MPLTRLQSRKTTPFAVYSRSADGSNPAKVRALDCAPVEYRRCFTENKIRVAGDKATSKILPRPPIDEQSVLIAEESDVIENCAISGDPECDSCRQVAVDREIFERQIARHKGGRAAADPDGLAEDGVKERIVKRNAHVRRGRPLADERDKRLVHYHVF